MKDSLPNSVMSEIEIPQNEYLITDFLNRLFVHKISLNDINGLYDVR